jgi:K+-sensing histidine kinase KdpD
VFLNFGRRTQKLVSRQLGHIDDLEARTDDPDTLEDLFLLDHLATRLRRNAEGLVVMAGADSPRRWSRPVTIINVVRAAAAEAADYSRVDVEPMAPGAVIGTTANDISHLLAELIDNGLACSPPHSRVTIAGDRQPDGGYLLTVTDAGPGLSAQQLAVANERLSRPPTDDDELSHHFGLFVAGQFARRHEVHVVLAAARPHGTTARVRLPATVMARTAASNGTGRAGSVVAASDTVMTLPATMWPTG